MHKNVLTILLFFVAGICFADNSQSIAKEDEKKIIDLGRSYFSWAKKNNELLSASEPGEDWSKGATHVKLKMEGFSSYKNIFLSSGLFAPDFGSHLDAYYKKYQLGLAKQANASTPADTFFGNEWDYIFCGQEGIPFFGDEPLDKYYKDIFIKAGKPQPDGLLVTYFYKDFPLGDFVVRKNGEKYLISRFCYYGVVNVWN